MTAATKIPTQREWAHLKSTVIRFGPAVDPFMILQSMCLWIFTVQSYIMEYSLSCRGW